MTDIPSPQRIAVIGGGWAGMAAAVRAQQAGHRVTVLEAARQLGGRARAMPLARLPPSLFALRASGGGTTPVAGAGPATAFAGWVVNLAWL